MALIKTYIYLKYFDKAEEAIKKVIEKNNKYNLIYGNIEAYEILAGIYKYQERNPEFVANHYLKAIENCETYGTDSQEVFYRMMAHYYFQNKNYKKAEENYKKATHYGLLIKDSTSLAVDFAYLGWTLFKQNE